MNRLETHFAELRRQQKKAAIYFITAGDPTLSDTLDIMRALADNGADCIELGVPFSDPIADGPIIQESTRRAMEQGVTLGQIFDLVKRFRNESALPVVLMGYLNPILRFGLEKFVIECNVSGVDGLIVADLPYEEGQELEQLTRDHHVNLIYLLAPDIDPLRTEAIVKASSGFIYCVAQYSTTGAAASREYGVSETVKKIKEKSRLPVALGFGISSPEKAREMSRYADGIIIGSWLIKELERAQDKAERAEEFAREIQQIINSGRGASRMHFHAGAWEREN